MTGAMGNVYFVGRGDEGQALELCPQPFISGSRHAAILFIGSHRASERQEEVQKI